MLFILYTLHSDEALNKNLHHFYSGKAVKTYLTWSPALFRVWTAQWALSVGSAYKWLNSQGDGSSVSIWFSAQGK